MDAEERSKREQGFTLIELLIAIVVVGILAAVAIVGISGLTSTGGKSACQVSADAATAASTAFYSNNSNQWPATIQAMATASATAPVNTPPVFSQPAGAAFAGAGSPSTMTVGSWTLTQTGGGANQPSFACSS